MSEWTLNRHSYNSYNPLFSTIIKSICIYETISFLDLKCKLLNKNVQDTSHQVKRANRCLVSLTHKVLYSTYNFPRLQFIKCTNSMFKLSSLHERINISIRYIIYFALSSEIHFQIYIFLNYFDDSWNNFFIRIIKVR